MLTLKHQVKHAIVAILAAGTAITTSSSSFAQAQSTPPGITQATALNYKNVRDYCKGSVNFALRQSTETDTAGELQKLDQSMQTLATFKKDYRTTANLKSNMQGAQEMRLAMAYETILEIKLVYGTLSGDKHFKPVIESIGRCQKDVERLYNRKIAVDQVELDQIFVPYHELMKPLEATSEILSDYDQLYEAYLKLNPAPAGATDSQVDDAEYKAAIKAVEALLSH